MQALARLKTKDAIERLAFWMASDNAKASVSASIALLDRAWGRPAQTLHHEGATAVPIFALPLGVMPSVSKQERG